MGEDELETLRFENALLRDELRKEWESNHAEHCGGLPCRRGTECYYPPPDILDIPYEEVSGEVKQRG